MTNENEAPEQIWVEDERPIGGDCHVYNEPIKGFCNPIRYTLADLSDGHIAELEAENRELHMQVIASDGQAQMAYEEQERLEAKLAKVVADMKSLTAVSTLMQSSASHDSFRHNSIVTDSIWSQWSKQLKFARTTLAELKGTD